MKLSIKQNMKSIRILNILKLLVLAIFTFLISACDTAKKPEPASPEQTSLPYVYEDESILELTEEEAEPSKALETSKTSNVNASQVTEATLPISEPLPKGQFKTVEWTDLMPKEDLDAILNPPKYVTEVQDGSIEDQISSQLQNSLAAANDDRYQQALSSTKIIQEMDGQAIRIPGFIVPLEFNDEQTITQFFLVPFFGACIHVPPPPPNQIIFVDAPQGIKLSALYDPFWVSGVLSTSLVENDIATSAYRLQLQYFEAYDE